MKEKPSLPVRFLKGFVMFWWDFLVGDTPEITVAVALAIGVAAVISLRGHLHAAAAVALLTLAVGALGASLWRAKRAFKK